MIWVLVHFLLVLTLGWNVTVLIKRYGLSILERLALSYALGSGLLTFIMFIIGFPGASIAPLTLGAGSLVIVILLTIINRRYIRGTFRRGTFAPVSPL